MKLYGYPNWVYSMFSFLGMLLVCIPLPWHLHAGNTGTVMYIFWAAISCLNAFVNSVVWTGNAINHAPVWCDISSRLIIAESVAIPAASLAINMNLYSISSSTRVGGKTKEEKRHQLVSDLLITIGIPVLSMVMYYIPQGHRFDIYEDVGCYPETYNTWVAFVCVYTWPLVISCISATYGVRSLWHFNKRRKDYNELLSARVNNNIDKNRYWRLMGLSSMDIVITIPMSCWALHTNAQQIEPWISWANTHTDFSRVVLYPGLIWRLSKLAYTALEATRWAYVMSAFIFFAFFGFGQEASSNYKKWYRFVAKYLRLPIPEWMKDPNETPRRFEASNNNSLGSGRDALPTHVRRKKRDSLDSIMSDSKYTSSDTKATSPAIKGSSSTSESPSKDSAEPLELMNGDIILGDVGGLLGDKAAVTDATKTCGGLSESDMPHNKASKANESQSRLSEEDTVSVTVSNPASTASGPSAPPGLPPSRRTSALLAALFNRTSTANVTVTQTSAIRDDESEIAARDVIVEEMRIEVSSLRPNSGVVDRPDSSVILPSPGREVIAPTFSSENTIVHYSEGPVTHLPPTNAPRVFTPPVHATDVPTSVSLGRSLLSRVRSFYAI